MADERPRDVRDSLSELEQRLLELERELRADATRDAGATRQRIPVPRPPSGGAATLAAERASGAAERVGTTASREGERRASPQGAGRAFAVRASDPAGAPPGDPPPPDVGPLVDETRRKVDALRVSLDGLTDAGDRLREVAQVVVEDHGRALVRLERATMQQEARAAATSDAPAEFVVPPAPAEFVVPPAPLAPAPAPPADPGAVPATPDDRTRSPRRWLWPALATLLTGAAVAVIVVTADRGDDTSTTPTVPGAMSRIALTPELGPDARAFASVPGTRPASDAGAANDVCDGVVGAAVVIRVSGADAVPPCRGLVRVASGSVSALALAEHRSSRKRTCVDAADVPSIAAARPDRRLTTSRDSAVTRATDRAERANAGSKLTPGERAGRVHTAAFETGRAFDARRRLRLLAVRPASGRACVVPGRDDVASGRYPLTSRIELLAMQSSIDQLAVDRAASVIGHLTSGPAPISATVLRRAR